MKKDKSSLKFGLIGMLIIFAALPILILGIIGTFSTINYTNKVRMTELSDISLSRSGIINTMFETYQADAAALSKMESVIKSAQNSTDDGLEVLKAIAETNDDIHDALVLDANGSVATSSLGVEKGAFEHFNAENMPAVSTVLSWEKYGFSSFFVSREIYSDPDTKTKMVGYVCLVISPESTTYLMNALGGTFLEDGKAHFTLADSEGNVINYRGQGNVVSAGEVDASFRSIIDEIFANVPTTISDKDVSKGVYTHNNGKYAVAAGSIPNVTSWRWVGFADSSSFSEFSNRTNIISWLIVVLSALIASGIGFIIVNKFVGSMHDMLKKMNSISFDDGIKSLRFNTKKDKSELGMIKSSFNEFLEEVDLNSQRYRTIASLSDNMLFEWDFHKETMYVSDNTLAKFDINTETATLANGRFLDSLMSESDAEKYKRDINKLLKSKRKFTQQYQLMSKSGANIWVSLSATCITDRLDEPLRVIGVLTDIDNEKKLEMQLAERASYDFLSQLYNRSTFIKKLSGELDRRGPKKIAVMFIDVDDFKFINDRYGHTVGDEVIRFVADTVRTKVEKSGGFAGRFGGDEFVLCFTDQSDIANIEQIATNIIDELHIGHTASDGTLINVRASIGIAICPDHTDKINDLLSFSDTAMYFVKKNGKRNYHIYVSADSESGEYNDPEGINNII